MLSQANEFPHAGRPLSGGRSGRGLTRRPLYWSRAPGYRGPGIVGLVAQATRLRGAMRRRQWAAVVLGSIALVGGCGVERSGVTRSGGAAPPTSTPVDQEPDCPPAGRDAQGNEISGAMSLVEGPTAAGPGPTLPPPASAEEALERYRNGENANLRAFRATTGARSSVQPERPTYWRSDASPQPGARPEVAFIGRDRAGVHQVTVVARQAPSGGWVVGGYTYCGQYIAAGGEL
jgi:hypothetical protein